MHMSREHFRPKSFRGAGRGLGTHGEVLSRLFRVLPNTVWCRSIYTRSLVMLRGHGARAEAQQDANIRHPTLTDFDAGRVLQHTIEQTSGGRSSWRRGHDPIKSQSAWIVPVNRVPIASVPAPSRERFIGADQRVSRCKQPEVADPAGGSKLTSGCGPEVVRAGSTHPAKS